MNSLEMTTVENNPRLDQSFYKKMAFVAVPVVIQNLISIGLNMVDVLMIGRLGENELAAVGSGNQVFFIYSMLCFGFYSGAAVYVAQYWGIKDIEAIRHVLGIDYIIGIIMAVITFLVAYFFAPGIIWLFSREPEVIALGTDYLRIVCFSYMMTSISFVVIYNSRAIQKLKAVTTINASALAVNTFLNYCLIYGNFGLPALGVKGAAIATVIARAIELALVITYVYVHKNHPFHASIKEMFSFSKSRFRRVMHTALPVVLTEGGWATVVALTFVAYGMLGPSALAVVQVAVVISNLSQVAYFGLGNATAVIIGEALGRGDSDRAFQYGKTTMKITWVLNIIVMVMMIACSKPIAGFYNFNKDTTHLLVLVIIAWSFTTIPKMLAYVLIGGILRAGGDTVYTLTVDLTCNIFIQLTVAFFSVLVLKLPLYFVVVLVSSSDLVKSIFCYRRFYSKKWMNIVT